MRATSFFLGLTVMTMFGLSVVSAHKLDDDPSPEFLAFTYRDSLMHVVSAQLDVLDSMAEGKREPDNAAFMRASNNLLFLSRMYTDAFNVRATVEESLASPEIWNNRNDFVARVNNLMGRVEALIITASEHGVDAAMPLVNDVSEACSDCHREYRLKR